MALPAAAPRVLTLRRVVVTALFAATVIGGALLGVFFAFESDLPQVTSLEDFKPNIITQVFANDGSVIGEFAIEKRVVVAFQDIPPVLRNAIVAVEDADFWKHIGINLWRIPGAALANLRSGRYSQGFSTLTMQLTRLLFLTPEKTPERKIKEVILAFQIEKNFTKEEILTLYCNQIYFGNGNYGVEAASRFLFGKAVKDVTLEEAALVAGIAQSPMRQSPIENPERALQRRNHVLDRMAEEKYVSREEAEAAKAKPIALRLRRDPPSRRPALRRGGPQVPRARVRQPAHLPGRAARLHDARPQGAARRLARRAHRPARDRPAGPRLREARSERLGTGRPAARAAAPRRVGLAVRRGRRGARRGDRVGPAERGGAGRRLPRAPAAGGRRLDAAHERERRPAARRDRAVPRSSR